MVMLLLLIRILFILPERTILTCSQMFPKLGRKGILRIILIAKVYHKYIRKKKNEEAVV